MPADAKPCLAIDLEPLVVDAVACHLELLGADSFELRDGSTLTTAGPGKATLIAGFPDPELRDRARATLASSDTALETATLEVGDDGWSSAWRAFFKPVAIGPLIVITPWMEPEQDGLEPVIIDPGQAFGTGGHATTRLLIEMLVERTRAGQPERNTLDIGTGSGVLAIAAAKLARAPITAIDIDPEAVRAARANCAINAVADRVDVRQADPSDIDGSFGLVIANIDISAFRKCAPAIRRLVASAGELLLSGLLAEHVDECKRLYPDLELDQRLDSEGWAALCLVPRP